MALAGVGLLLALWWQLDARPALEELHVESDDHWREAGFVEMVSPIAAPTSADERDVIQVWLHLPATGEVDVEQGADGRPLLVLPAGTLADRVERHLTADGSRVIDVRGTEITLDGGQRFHLLRRVNGALRGFAWKRGSAPEEAEASERVADLVPPAAVTKLRALNDCASCHVEQKPEQVVAGERFLPNRRTDAVGFYQVQAIFDDEQPLETARPRDMNVDRPFVQLLCAAGAAVVNRSDGGQRRVACADGSVPRARYDVAAARAAGDERALGVCTARAYLHERMSRDARDAFAAAFAACGLTEDEAGGQQVGLDLKEKETASWKKRASK